MSFKIMSSLAEIAYRTAIHLFNGGVLVVTMGLSYYSITAFVEDSSQSDAPASLLAWCMLTPTSLIMGYLANQHMLTDFSLPSAIKIFFLCIELALAITVIYLMGLNPLFACGISGCTYDILPEPIYEDQVTSTWHSESAMGALALFYYFYVFFSGF